MKKTLGIVLILSMLACGDKLFLHKIKDVQAMTNIRSNQWYEEMTDGRNDQIYTYKMQGSGYFYYQVIPDTGGYYYDDKYEKSTNYYISTTMTKNDKVYVDDQYSYYSKGGYKSVRYAFKVGDKIKIKVCDSNGYKTHYKIKITFKKMKNFENEGNDSKSKANVIKKGVTYTGLAMEDDIDWFVFKAPKTKKYKIKSVCINEGMASYSHAVESYKGYKQNKFLHVISGRGWETVFSGKLKKGQKVYVKISDGGDDEMYKLRVK